MIENYRVETNYCRLIAAAHIISRATFSGRKVQREVGAALREILLSHSIHSQDSPDLVTDLFESA